MGKECVTYHINKDQRIVFINDNWGLFADNNMAGHLTSHAVLNESIYSFITDESCCHLYQLLIERCRERQEVLELSFRCDSPDKRRFMLMKIYPLEKESIGFRSCIEREEDRDPVKLLSLEIERSNQFLTICSWCKRVKLDNNYWLEVEAAIEKLKLLGTSPLPQLTHGMCPECYEYVQMKRLTQ